MTAPIAQLVARRSATRVVRHLTTAAASVAGSPIRVNVIIDDQPAVQAAALRGAVDLLILDGHGHNWPSPRVGNLLFEHDIRAPNGTGTTAPGIALGCCEGRTPAFLRALRAVMDKPAAVLACDQTAGYSAGQGLWTALLHELAAYQRPITAAQMADVMKAALQTARSSAPRLNWKGWDVTGP